MSGPVQAGGLRDRQLDAMFDAVVSQLTDAGQAPLVAFVRRNRAVVRVAIATIMFPQETQKPKVDWTSIPLVTQADEWTAAQRRDANIAALVALRQLAMSGRGARDFGESTPIERILSEISPSGMQMRAWELLQESPKEYSRISACISRYSGWGGVVVSEKDFAPGGVLMRKLKDANIKRSDLSSDFRNVLDEYYTPSWFARATWQLLARLHDRGYIPQEPYCFEPSAGIGRFIFGGPEGIRWLANELDPLSSLLLAARSPSPKASPGDREIAIINGSLQELPFKAQDEDAKEKFDLVVANPPYGNNPDTKIDLETFYFPPGGGRAEPWSKLVPYFIHRCVKQLKPKGVTVQLVPLEAITGGGEMKKMRSQVLREAHWLSAWAPPMDMFPGARLGLCFIVLQKRLEPLSDVVDADQEILDGRYFDTTNGKNHISGRWATDIAAEKGQKAYREGAFGVFDSDAFVGMELRPEAKPEDMPVSDAPEQAKAAPALRRKRKGRKSRKKVTTPEEVMAIGTQIASWRLLRQSHPEIAANGIDELTSSIESYIEEYGNPNDTDVSKDTSPEAQALLSVVLPDGKLSADLVARNFTESGFKGDKTDFQAVIDFLSGRLGEARWSKILEIYEGPKDVLLAMDQLEEGAFVNALYDLDPVFWADREYLTGNLYARLDEMDASTKSGLPGDAFLRRYRVQRAKLIEVIDPVPIEMLNVSMRSDLVGAEVVSAYASDKLMGQKPVEITNTDGVWTAQQVGDLAPSLAVAKLVAYLNNDAMFNIENENQAKRQGSSVGKKARLYTDKSKIGSSSMTVAEKIDKDDEREREFMNWLRESDLGEGVAERFNRNVKGFKPRPEDTADLGLARLGPQMRKPDGTSKLYPYQIGVVRALTHARTGLIAHDVGLGKTFAALAMLAYWRQLGISRRAVFVVPKQVQLNWVRELKVLLPDYRPAVIGQRWNGKRWIKTKVEERDQQWSDFAAGRYDVAICTHPNFQELRMDPTNRLEMLREIAELRRDEAEVAVRIQTLKNLIPLAEDALSNYMNSWEKSDSGVESREKSIESMRSELLKLEDPEAFHRKKAAEAQKDADGLVSLISEAREKGGYVGIIRVERSGVSGLRYEGYSLAELEDELQKRQKRVASQMKAATKAAEGDNFRVIESAKVEAEQFIAATEYRTESEVGITFEQLGVDMLVVDEAHQFKNLFRAEAVFGQAVRFLGQARSKNESDVCKQCFDLFVKSAWVRKVNNQTGVILLTATPVTNSPLELYNLLYYCAPKTMEARGYPTSREFVARFCDIQQQITINTQGDPKEVPAVKGFRNLDELRYLLALYADVKNVDDSPALQKKVPDFVNINAMSDLDEYQEVLYGALRKYGDEALQQGPRAGGLLLKVISEMSDVALDVGLYQPNGPAKSRGFKRWKNSMLNASNDKATISAADGAVMKEAVLAAGRTLPVKFTECATNIVDRPGCAHIVFLDREEAHARLIEAMVDGGIPRDRIDQVTGSVTVAKRQKIVDAVNGIYEKDENGDDVLTGPPTLDVVIGTAAMSEGMNLQVRGCAIHHLDLPWTAATLQQRNGRAVRQKNRWAMETKKPVELFYYMAEKSFDGYKLQAVTGKAGWTETLFRSSSKSANNPMADSQADPLALVDLFARDPAATRKIVLARMAELASEQLKRKHLKAVQAFRQLVSVATRSRTEMDPDRAQAYRRAAESSRVAFEAAPKEIIQNKELLDIAMVKGVVWSPGEVLKGDDGTATVGPEAWLIEGEPFGTVSAYDIQTSGFPEDLSAKGKCIDVNATGRTFRILAIGQIESIERDWDRISPLAASGRSRGISRPVAAWDEASHVLEIKRKMRGNDSILPKNFPNISPEVLSMFPVAIICKLMAAVYTYDSGQKYLQYTGRDASWSDGELGEYVPCIMSDPGPGGLVQPFLMVQGQWSDLAVTILREYGWTWRQMADVEDSISKGEAVEAIRSRIGWPIMPTEYELRTFRSFESMTIRTAVYDEGRLVEMTERPTTKAAYRSVQRRWFGVKPIDLPGSEAEPEANPPRRNRAYFKLRHRCARR